MTLEETSRFQPKVILFDLDDTLISFELAAAPAWEKCCADFLSRFQLPIAVADLLASVNATRAWYWSDPDRHKQGRMDLRQARREIVALAMQKHGIQNVIMSNDLADSFTVFRESLIELFPDTIRTLEQLKQLGIRLGLITNGTSESQRGKLARFDLEKYFEYILIEGEVGFGKPDVRIYEKALSLFDVSPQECWMIGDNLVWDIQAPRSIGLCTVWHDYLKAGLPQNSPILPDHTILSPGGLITLLEDISRR